MTDRILFTKEEIKQLGGKWEPIKKKWYIYENNPNKGKIEIKNKYYWKTTSSKKISTKCKFELAKKHLNNFFSNYIN